MLNLLRSRKKDALPDRVWYAMRANKPEELRMLLSKKKANKLIRKTGGNVLTTCLLKAIAGRHFECIQELLKAGANVCNAYEYCPLKQTIEWGGDMRVLKLLLEAGAKPDADQEWDPYRPLHIAAKFALPGCFRMLLFYGADPDYNCLARDFLHSCPHHPIVSISVLGFCLRNDYETPFVNLLIQFGANMHSPDLQENRLLEVDNDAAKLLARERAHPRSLMSQCRIAIRRHLKQVGKLCPIDQLEIPNNLLRYLQFHNELDYPEKLPRHSKEVEWILSYTYPLMKS